MYDSIVNTLILLTCIGCLVLDYFICKYVKAEYEESKDTNKVLMQKLNKQRKQKQKISVDRVIKAAING